MRKMIEDEDAYVILQSILLLLRLFNLLFELVDDLIRGFSDLIKGNKRT